MKYKQVRYTSKEGDTALPLAVVFANRDCEYRSMMSCVALFESRWFSLNSSSSISTIGLARTFILLGLFGTNLRPASKYLKAAILTSDVT